MRYLNMDFVHLLLGSLVVAGCVHGPGPSARTADRHRGIVVVGDGTARARPDVAHVSLGIEVRRASVADAREAAASVMQRVLEALRNAGLGDEDLSTSQLSVQPEYDYTEQGRRLLGYTVRNMVDARVTNLDALSTAVDDATRAGGDEVRVNRLSFELSDDAPARAEARAEAMAEARASAEQLAELAGVSLGEPLAIREETAHAEGPRPMATEMRAANASPTPVEPGTAEVRVRLHVRYAIR